jgi:hypothetical protein
MSKSLRLLAVAAALTIIVAGTASAQTVIVRGAKPGETLEVVVNDSPANKGTVAADGTATVAGNLPANDAKRPEMDARLYLDTCDAIRRVIIVNRNQLPLPTAADCTRSDLTGIYWVRQRSTIVIDVSKPIPDVLLRQGSYNPNAPTRRLAPKGLVAFGGGGFAKLRDASAIACGDLSDCQGGDFVFGYHVGATLWLTRWFAVDGSYLRPSKMVTVGNGGTFTFSNRMDVDFLNVGVKGGLPLGPTRIYGLGGMTFHEARDTMTETIGNASQTVETHTDGWSYTYGAGFEGWINNRVALYGEAGVLSMKGKERLSEVIRVDDRLTYYIFGGRFRIF